MRFTKRLTMLGTQPESIAETIGTNYRIFINKVTLSESRNILSAREALAMVKVTGCEALPHLFARAAGGKFVKDTVEEVPSILDAALCAMREHGDVGEAIQAAMEDKRITDREANVIFRQIDEAIEAMLALRKSVDATRVGGRGGVVSIPVGRDAD